MARITLDIASLTLGEGAEAERQSGMNLQEMVKGRTNMLLLALFVHELRNSEKPRSWHELSNLRILDVSSSMQQSDSDGIRAKSNG